MKNLLAKDVSISCEDSRWVHLNFENKNPTTYECQKDEWYIKVKNSASARILVLEDPIAWKAFSFDWQLVAGSIETKSSQIERTKKGDDFILRIGLILHGPKPWIPFFAASWIKKVGALLKHPSDRMDYYVISPHSHSDSMWLSPYTTSIRNFAVNAPIPSVYPLNTWSHVRKQIEISKIVGIWWMSDGDDSQSTFELRVRNFKFDSVPNQE